MKNPPVGKTSNPPPQFYRTQFLVYSQNERKKNQNLMICFLCCFMLICASINKIKILISATVFHYIYLTHIQKTWWFWWREGAGGSSNPPKKLAFFVGFPPPWSQRRCEVFPQTSSKSTHHHPELIKRNPLFCQRTHAKLPLTNFLETLCNTTNRIARQIFYLCVVFNWIWMFMLWSHQPD